MRGTVRSDGDRTARRDGAGGGRWRRRVASTATPVHAAARRRSPASRHPPATGFSLVFADGSVRPRPFGDAFSLRPRVPVVAGAAHAARATATGSSMPTGNVFRVRHTRRRTAARAASSLYATRSSAWRRRVPGERLLARRRATAACSRSVTPIFHGSAQRTGAAPTVRRHQREARPAATGSSRATAASSRSRTAMYLGRRAEPHVHAQRHRRPRVHAHRQRLLDRAPRRTRLRLRRRAALRRRAPLGLRPHHCDRRQPRRAGLPARHAVGPHVCTRRRARRDPSPPASAVRAATQPRGSSSRARRSPQGTAVIGHLVVRQPDRPRGSRLHESTACKGAWAVDIADRAASGQASSSR